MRRHDFDQSLLSFSTKPPLIFSLKTSIYLLLFILFIFPLSLIYFSIVFPKFIPFLDSADSIILLSSSFSLVYFGFFYVPFSSSPPTPSLNKLPFSVSIFSNQSGVILLFSMDFVDNFLDIRVGMDLRQYADALDQERRKIQVFQRELPLCLELVTRAIDSCRQQLSGMSTESSEHTSRDGPVLEEFIPINKPSVNSHFLIEEDEQSKPEKNELGRSDWLKSAQLWNQSPDPPVTEEVAKETAPSVVEVKNNGGGGAFQTFQKETTTPLKTELEVDVGKTVGSSRIPEATSSTAETASNGGGGTSKREDKESQTQRKQRRCWSSELHRRFVHALQQLGGPHVATPKQIRELMKVDGLTNDEVKSHLQKYRLHARRPTNSAMQDSGSSSAPQQFVVVGSIWVPPPPPPKYTVATVAKARNGIYTPVATGERRQKTAEEGKRSHSGGVVHSNSSATSSCTHTTTTSPSAA